jgi:hypothetical protein
MKTKILFSVVFMAVISMSAIAQTRQNEQDIQPVEIAYLEDVYANKPWRSNWFISVKGGLTGFVGRPVGHGDIFDRTKPMLNVSAGKWITPYVGARFA